MFVKHSISFNHNTNNTPDQCFSRYIHQHKCYLDCYQDKVLTLYRLPKLNKKPIKQDLLLFQVLVRQHNFLNC